MLRDTKPSFADLSIGDCVSVQRTLTRETLGHFASIVGDVDPGGESDWFSSHVVDQPSAVHGAWVGALISATLALMLPGAGMGWLVQTLRFHEPILLGDSIAATVTVTEKVPDGWRVLLDCIATNQRGQTVVSGSTEATVPPA